MVCGIHFIYYATYIHIYYLYVYIYTFLSRVLQYWIPHCEKRVLRWRWVVELDIPSNDTRPLSGPAQSYIRSKDDAEYR